MIYRILYSSLIDSVQAVAILCMESFRVLLYQANFASHHTHDCHVAFPLPTGQYWEKKKIFHWFLFSSYHITKLQLSDKNTNTHTWIKLDLGLQAPKTQPQNLYFMYKSMEPQHSNWQLSQSNQYVG